VLFGVRFHRFGHEMNCLWAAHIAHHSSQEYNLSTALRQGAIQYSSSWVFNLPAAFFIPPPVFSFHAQFNRLYQFFIHTRTVDKLHPWIEWWFNTPSHHRAHHGSNPAYIDCNYSGTLIIFDRMFGTFVPEGYALERDGEPLSYGLTHNLRSWNPLWANFHHWQYMWTSSRPLGWSWRRLEVLWQRPGWKPGARQKGENELYDIPAALPLAPRYDRMAVKGVVPLTYLLMTFLGSIAALKVLLPLCRSENHQWHSRALFIEIMLAATTVGILMEGRWSVIKTFALDVARLGLAAVLAVILLVDPAFGNMPQEKGQCSNTAQSCISILLGTRVC
jgi:alkylglycerol monooxygenase